MCVTNNVHTYAYYHSYCKVTQSMSSTILNYSHIWTGVGLIIATVYPMQ